VRQLHHVLLMVNADGQPWAKFLKRIKDVCVQSVRVLIVTIEIYVQAQVLALYYLVSAEVRQLLETQGHAVGRNRFSRQ
jgi:hypothetical protein